MPDQELLPPPPKKKQVVSEEGLLPPPPKKKIQDGTGTALKTGGTVGSSNPQSVNSTNPFAIGGQYNQAQKPDFDKLDLSNTKHDAAVAEQIKTPLRKIPLTPILDQTKIQKPISEIDANEAIARQTQHKADMETAIDNTTLKVLKNKGIVAGKGSPLYETERKKIEEKTKPTMIGGIVVSGPEATYHKDKDGNIGLDRNLGFVEGIREGYNEAVNGEDEANAFADMTTEQKVQYANEKMQANPNPEYMSERSGVGGLIGGSVPYLVKAAAAGTLATAATIAAPETGGASLAGLAPTLTVLLTAPDMIKQGAKDEIMTRYQQLKQENPGADENELMKTAEQGEISGGLLGAANALAYTTSLKLPIAKESKDVLTTYLKGVTSSAIHLGGITGASKAAQLAERKLEGYNVDTDKAIDEIKNTVIDNGTAGGILAGLIHGAQILPKAIKSAYKYALKDTPISEIKTALQANVDAGRIPPEVAEQTIADIDGYKAALAKTADGLKPETQASVAGLIQARDNVAAEMATKDPTQRATYEQKIEAYNKQIEKITKTNEPLKYEIDEVTGNPIDKVAPEPKEPTFEDKVRETYPTLKEANDKEINDFVKENATDDPTQFIEKFGQEKFDEIVKDTPTKDLQDKLDMAIKGNADSPNVDILDKIISERVKEQPTVSETEGKSDVVLPTEQQSGKDGKVAPDAELGIQQGYAKKAMTDFINSPDMGYSIHEEGGKTALGLSEAQVRSANGLKGGDRMQSHEHTNIELTKDEKKQLNKIESDKELGDIDGLEYAKQKRALAKKIFERASNELQQKANEQSGKDGVGELKITDKTKDILDEVSDEKIGEKKYQDFSIDFEDGARAYGKIEDAVADISGINAPKEDGKVVRGSKTYERVLSKLKENGVKTVNIKLQSNDSEAAIKKLVDNGLLTNPRNIMGSSGNEHPVTFDIGSKVNFIEKKNTGTEIEPELGDGRKPVTLSGSTEAERQVAIEQRKKETKQTPMTESRDKLLERIQKYNKLSRSEKRQAYIEANKIKLAVDNFNNTHEQKHSLSTNRDGSLELRNNPTEKRASGKPIKNTLKGNENAIVDNGKPLMERDDNTKKVFNDLLDADVLPVSRRVNGEKMSDAEHEATIQDIMDGIPSQRAENYLNSLEKQIKDDNFDFGNPDKNVRTTLNDALNITVEKGEPMTPDAIEKWLSNESELTPEEQTTFDNIDNLITHYEQLHESENGTPAKVQQPAGKGQESNSGKANENGQPKSETSTANKKEPIKNEEAKANENTNKETGDSTPKPETGEAASATTEGKEGGKEPPKEPAEPVGEDKGKDRLNDKGILNHLESADNVPEAARVGFKEKGLKYNTSSQKEAEGVAKSVIDKYGIEDAVLLAESQKFDGDVNSLIYAESLNRLGKMEAEAKTPEEKLAIAKQFAEVGIKYDEAGRKGGRFSSAINYFYKKSPLGIQMIENAKRKETFEDWSKPKDKSWKEFFDEMMKEPEFDAIIKEQIKEGMKQERAEARAARIKKVDEFFDKAKDEFKGGAAYSTIIPPKVITTALEGMKRAYHAGEKVAKLVEDAIDYISNELGGAVWDKEKFRKEWEEKLQDKPEKKKLTDEEVKAKVLDRFRNKLKGLTDKQKEDVVRKSFAKIVESGGLDYADFRKIIADVTGRGEMTEAESAKLKELVTETNAVDEAGNRARTERTQAAREAFRETEKKAGKAQRELNELLYNKPNITKRLTSLMQLNTLGIPALVNNPVYNVVNQLGLRTPVGLFKTGVDKAIYYGAKAFGKEVLPETNILSVTVQKEFFKKLGLGTRESVGQFLTGLNRMDYLNKEIQGQQIRPATAMRDLWAYSKGEKNLTRAQVIDKVIQASPPGITAEIIARTLNLGDKPQRFAAEGAQAAAFAKSLGLKDIDYDLFIDFPREEAYMQYKKKGWSDAKAAEQADYIRDTIVKEGERSTFQQDNFANDILSRIFGSKDSGVGGLVKATVISPYTKIPTNAFWSYYNIVNPEMAMLQSMVYAGKAYAKTKGIKFDFDKHNSSAKKDMNEAKYWLAHAAVGMATRAVIVSLVGAGVFRSGNTQDDTKKEREGEQFYEDQGTLNVSKLFAIMKGEDPNKVQNGLVIKNKWFGHWGTVGNTIAKKYEDMTPEQKSNNADFWDAAIGGMELGALQDLNQGVFGNTSSLLGAINQGVNTGSIGSGFQAWGVNTVNMFTNIVHPAASAQIERAALPYYTKQKADTFLGELKNSMLTRSAVLRKLSGQYPPSKIGIWGDRLDKKENMVMSLFGFSHNNPDNFAQPIYEDYKKTNNTKFFPPAVMPTITDNGVKVKLPTADAARFEQLVGQQRKKLVAPYINDMATFEGSGKVYSKLTPDEKLDKLDILYEEGYNNAKYLFLKEKPQYKQPVKSGQEKKEDNQDKKENATFRKAIKKKLIQ